MPNPEILTDRSNAKIAFGPRHDAHPAGGEIRLAVITDLNCADGNAATAISDVFVVFTNIIPMQKTHEFRG